MAGMPNFATNEYVEYNETLYKAILPLFTHHIDAIHLVDCHIISDKLTTTDMQIVRREYDNKGMNLGASKLLEILYRKVDWFGAFMRALEHEDLKVRNLKPKFQEEKLKVDRDWVAKHPQPPPPQDPDQVLPPPTQVGNPSVGSSAVPTQSSEELERAAEDRRNMPPPPPMETDVPPSARTSTTVSDGASGDISSDFRLTPGQDIRLGTDAVEEDMGVDPVKAVPGDQQTAQEAKEAEGGGASEPSTSTGEPEEYTDARSSDYERLGRSRDEDENTYAYLANIETDACPIPEPPSDVPQPEVGVDAVPQVLTPQQQAQRRRRRPQTREEHPSLRQAISGDPRKDMEAEFVRSHLSAFEGWTTQQEEHQVIRIIRSHQSTNGIYVIWYWSLAKRPTICVTYNGKVITFVVHKSPHDPPVFYFNKHQKRCQSMGDLIRFHLEHGIKYTPRGGQAVDIRLTRAYNAPGPAPQQPNA